ncbi:hypothetical protein CVH13_01686, partial [Dehalococcoides mccartyi]
KAQGNLQGDISPFFANGIPFPAGITAGLFNLMENMFGIVQKRSSLGLILVKTINCVSGLFQLEKQVIAGGYDGYAGFTCQLCRHFSRVCPVKLQTKVGKYSRFGFSRGNKFGGIRYAQMINTFYSFLQDYVYYKNIATCVNLRHLLKITGIAYVTYAVAGRFKDKSVGFHRVR